MGAATPSTGIKIPPEFVGLHAALVDFCHEFIVAFLTDGSADDLTNLREEDIGWRRGSRS